MPAGKGQDYLNIRFECLSIRINKNNEMQNNSIDKMQKQINTQDALLQNIAMPKPMMFVDIPVIVIFLKQCILFFHSSNPAGMCRIG